jgi:hypothetical protein
VLPGKVIVTLAITILIESAIIVGYARWRKKPLTHLLFSTVHASTHLSFMLKTASSMAFSTVECLPVIKTCERMRVPMEVVILTRVFKHFKSSSL